MGMFCEKCGCKLASDHRGDVCTPCSRTPTPSDDAPPTAPAGFWQRDDVHAAIDERHFGKIICAYRCAFSPPINQGRMAEWLGVGQSQVSRIERGRPPADLVKLIQWARVLQAPASLLWFQLPGNASDASPIPEPAPNLVPHQHHDRGDDVQRRDVLKLAGAAAMSAAPWQRLANTLEHGYAPDAAAISLVEDRTTEFFHLEETTPSRTILASLTEHGATLRQLLEATTREQDRRRLLSAAGEAEALAGWLTFDLSQPREAVSRYKHALKLAEEAGDGPLTACTLNYWSYLLASQDKSAEAVEVLGKAVEYVRGSAATTQAWVSARQAEEAARVGDDGTAERALERAFTAYEYARPHHERSWTSFFGASRLGSLAVSSYG